MLLNYFVKEKVIALLNKMGYDLVKFNRNVKDLTGNKDDVKKLLFHAKSHIEPYLCYVPVEYLRGHVMSFRFDDKCSHPFTKAVNEAKEITNQKSCIKGVLEEYYEMVEPANAAEVLGLNKSDIPQFAKEEPWVAVHPWEDRTIEDVVEKRPRITLSENLKYGAKIGIEHGWHLFGKVSDLKLSVETKRIHKLMKSVIKNGYVVQENDNNISSVLLVNEDGECRWVIYDGQHRTAVLSGLGYKQIPVMVNKIVERKDVGLWPGVIAGDFTRTAALKIFDNVFNGVPSRCLRNYE